MRRFLLVLFLFGLETRALAHEDYISVFDHPAQLALMVLIYGLPGAIFDLISAWAFPRVHIAFRVLTALVMPIILWTVLLVWTQPNHEVSLLDGLGNIIWGIFFNELWAVIGPGTILICGVSYLNERRRIRSSKADRFVSID
ncbi:MAG: hypothetical protein AAGK17_06160 [Pseudomonadota bacterium]